MEKTVTQQPRLSSSKGSVSGFRFQEMAELIPGSENRWKSQLVSTVTDPVLIQPGLGVTTATVTTITQTGGDWSTRLCDVCSDRNTCILGALLPCCLDLSLAHEFGESFCLPLLPGSTFALRVGIRERYKIQFSLTGQCVRRLDFRALLLPSGLVSDGPRDEEEDEDQDVSRDHRAGLLLKKLPSRHVYYCSQGTGL